jgi:hypothetical protein
MSESNENRSSDQPDGNPGGDASVQDAPAADTFAGYDLETGVLQRVRRWRDAIPALVLIDALRVAGSPLYVGLFWIAVSIASLLPITWSIDLPVGTTLLLGIDRVDDLRWWSLAVAIGLIIIGTLPAALAARGGACYAAGRTQSFTDNGRVTLARWLRLFAIPLAPVAITAGLSVVMVAAGAFGRIGGIGSWLVEVTAVAGLPIAILIGLIAGGAVAAVPLAIAATVLEKQSDVLDSLSRGYEYLYRRPVYLLFYSTCSAIMVAIVWQLALLVTHAAILVGGWGLQIGSGETSMPRGFQWLLLRLPLAAAFTAGWGQVGAIYLLMRQAANDQEVEDIATSPSDTRFTDMPNLKSEI